LKNRGIEGRLIVQNSIKNQPGMYPGQSQVNPRSIIYLKYLVIFYKHLRFLLLHLKIIISKNSLTRKGIYKNLKLTLANVTRTLTKELLYCWCFFINYFVSVGLSPPYHTHKRHDIIKLIINSINNLNFILFFNFLNFFWLKTLTKRLKNFRNAI